MEELFENRDPQVILALLREGVSRFRSGDLEGYARLLQEARRVLRPNGRIVFSFLESERNWPIFQGMVDRAAAGSKDDQLNMFTERSQIEAWAKHLDMGVLGYDFGLPHEGDGQTVAMLAKR